MARRLGKRKQQPREVYMLKEQNKVDSGIFDTKTMIFLSKFFNKGVISTLGHIIARGKEADLYMSEPGESPSTKGMEHVMMKFFRIETSSFFKMADYMSGDPRFSRIARSKSKYGIVIAWTTKEYGNLEIAKRAKVHAPTPIMFNGSILAMSFIGEGDTPAPQLRNAEIDNPEKVLDAILMDLKRLYKHELVHGDMSEYNILMKGNTPYLIDFGQAVMLRHPKANDFLKRDVYNVLRYFNRAYGIERSEEEELKKIVS